jgi:hypothetical protein
MKLKGWVVIIASALALVMVRSASAHTPIFVERDITSLESAWPVGDYAISWAFYGRVTPAGAPQYFSIEGRKGDRLFASLEVPEIAGLEDFRPALALIGPGLPAFDAPPGVSVPSGYGGLRVDDPNAAPRDRFDEPFSQTRYYRGPRFDVQLPAAGRYYVTVFDTSGATGKYTLAIGTREVFGGGDPAWSQKLHAFFGDAGQDPAPQPASPAGVSLARPVFLPMWFKVQ